MGFFFFKWALIAYFLSTVGYVTSLLVRRVLVAKVSTVIFAVAFVIHTLSIVFRFLLTGYEPVAGFHDLLSLFAWVMTGIYLILQLKTKTRVLGAFVSPLVFLLVIVASIRLEPQVSVPDIVRGYLVCVHILLSVTGEAIFVIASCAGAMYLIQNGFIKHKKMGSFSRLLPSLIDLDRINHICLLLGFPMLTLGVLVGSVWARTVWGSNWQWDPKQIWTLAAWLFYALLLHQRLAIGWKGYKVALLSVIAFVILVLSFVVENVFFTTVHNFI
jgi:cytochrome c-type biogenesis protein CcsB